MDGLFLGIDVGTTSVRAGLFGADGALVARSERPIRLWRDDGGFVEQSSQDIWNAVCAAVREAVQRSGQPASCVKGLGFDATCSLVVVGQDGAPLTVSRSGEVARNVIVWMDHRAMEETAAINATRHPVLAYVGGKVSPEMQTPKLLWLKANLPETFERAGHFFDLSDFLSFRATGSTQRSVCTLTCKWTYLAHESRFDAGFFGAIGLQALAAENFKRIGPSVVDIATPLGQGLTEAAGQELGLLPGTPVGASLIDAHAGGVGTLGGMSASGEATEPSSELAFIMGTSSCTMALTREPAFVDGVWGPYYSAMIPGYWLLEGGQSAYGAALDALLAMHPAHAAALAEAEAQGMSVYDLLERRAVVLAGSLEATASLARGITILPEFLGNRSPEADPNATAAIAGLTLGGSVDHLVRFFVAALCGLCFGTRQIVEANRDKGVSFETIVVSGGAARSALLRRILADATGLRVALPATSEPVLLGSAILGTVAAGHYPDLSSAAASMCRTGDVIEPASGEIAALHERGYRAYEILRRAEREIRTLQADA